MSCCNNIRRLLGQVKATTLSMERKSLTDEDLVVLVTNSLKVYREVLGNHRIGNDITKQFRTTVEPALAKVWTRRELHSYANKLLQLGNQLEHRLQQWESRYCHEKE